MNRIRSERRTDAGNGVVRLAFVAFAAVLQIYFFYLMMSWLDNYSTVIHLIVELLAVILVLGIYGQHITTSMKLPWIVLITSAPVLGVTLWFLMASKSATKPMASRLWRMEEAMSVFLKQESGRQETLRGQNSASFGVASYLWRRGRFPLYADEGCRYYANAAEAFEAQLEDLRNARHYIFMEYFAIEDKESFARVREILRQKAAEGLDVRLFYDDVGSIGFISLQFQDRLREEGIQAKVFNPVLPGLRVFMNNRDHRKITVIDGRIAYTGGYNIANEYFNVTHPYGEWKDAGIRVTGKAVNTFTAVFLELWNAIRKADNADSNFEQFFPAWNEKLRADCRIGEQAGEKIGEQAGEKTGERTEEETGTEPAGEEPYGFIQPYADAPLDEELVGENVYMSIANGASQYLYFVTPYLVLTDEMSRALSLAAERGADVRIVTPGIPDKKITYQLTRSYYAQLVRKGVRIYEFTPGFCHAKCCVSDDRIATCGTINLDYRSLYHHFEDGCVLYHSRAVLDMKADMEHLIERSTEVTEQYAEGNRNVLIRGFQCVLRLAAPLF